MLARISASLVLLAIGLAPAILHGDDEFVVAGYLPSYRLSSWDIENVGPLNNVLYFHTLPTESGPIPSDAVSETVRTQLAELRRDTGVRLSITVGGWGHSDQFAAVCGDDTKRAALVRSLVELCHETAIDSVDYDWEHPKTEAEWKSYVAVVRETREAVRPLGGLCTIALAPWNEPPEEMFGVVDRVNLMSYDHSYPHATIEKSTEDINRVLDWGCPPKKLVLGIPFYGRAKDWKATSYTKLVADKQVSSGDLSEGGVAFNNAKTVAAKVRMARSRGLGGVMVWELGHDTTDERTSLLKVIASTVQATR